MVMQHLFVDRNVCLQNFKDALNNLGPKKISVLVYYGVAGIGKTSLRNEFIKCLKTYNKENKNPDSTLSSILQQEIIWTSVDLQLDEHRKKNTFLVTLKDNLQEEFKIDFPAFEIAHAIYWKKANPEIPLRKDNYLLFKGNNAFDDIFAIASKISPLGIVHNAGKLILKNLPDYLQKWWTTKGEKELKQLSEKEPLIIEERLSYFWAQDLNNYLKCTSKPAVLFIDTYEVLRENYSDNGYSLDKWIRELILLLPERVLWVICGREALKWEETKGKWREYITQYEVEKLLRKYCFEYLETRKITYKEIQEAIFNGSRGVPYYLDLSAETHEKIMETGGKPKPEDFGKNHKEIADRFFRFLRHEEKKSLNVLSIPRFWDYDLFEYLVKKFNTGYSTNDYEDLCSFSFIVRVENEIFQMHQLMQESLQKTQRSDSVKRIHKAICDYYSDKLGNVDIKAITKEQEIALIEAFYHAKKTFEAEDLLNWFVTVSDSFEKAALWQLITPMYEEMLQVLEQKLGSEHPDVATTLNNLSSLYRQMGAYDQALPLYQRALEIYEKVLGPEHPDVATTLNNLSLLYESMGDYEKALPLYQRALEIREKVLGPEHPDVATTLNNLAELYRQMGAYDQALSLYQRALEIYEKVLGPGHPDVATTLNNLAIIYYKMGDYEKALPLYQRALEIYEKVLGPGHPYVAATQNNLAELYRQMGAYDQALPLHQRALEIREKVLGPEHPDVAQTLNNLAIIYYKMGDYEKALPLYQRALEIREKVLGPEHPDVAQTLNNLAALYYKMEDYEKALPLYQRALEIREKVLGPGHPDVATTLDNLAVLCRQMGDYEKALPFTIRALDIYEKALGPECPDVAHSLNNLAIIYYKMGAYNQALSLYQRALEIREKVLGPGHPDVATTFNNLAELYRQMGDYEKALPLYQRALEIYEKVLGPGHPDVAQTLNNLSSLYRYMGDYEKAFSLSQRIGKSSNYQK